MFSSMAPYCENVIYVTFPKFDWEVAASQSFNLKIFHKEICQHGRKWGAIEAPLDSSSPLKVGILKT